MKRYSLCLLAPKPQRIETGLRSGVYFQLHNVHMVFVSPQMALISPSKSFLPLGKRLNLDELFKFLYRIHCGNIRILQFGSFPGENQYIVHISFAKHQPPEFSILIDILRSISEYRNASPSNLVVFLCNESSSCQAAFVACSFGMWHRNKSLDEILDLYSRTATQLEVCNYFLNHNCLLRWLRYVEKWSSSGDIYRESNSYIMSIGFYDLASDILVDIKTYKAEEVKKQPKRPKISNDPKKARNPRRKLIFFGNSDDTALDNAIGDGLALESNADPQVRHLYHSRLPDSSDGEMKVSHSRRRSYTPSHRAYSARRTSQPTLPSQTRALSAGSDTDAFKSLIYEQDHVLSLLARVMCPRKSGNEGKVPNITCGQPNDYSNTPEIQLANLNARGQSVLNRRITESYPKRGAQSPASDDWDILSQISPGHVPSESSLSSLVGDAKQVSPQKKLFVASNPPKKSILRQEAYSKVQLKEPVKFKNDLCLTFTRNPKLFKFTTREAGRLWINKFFEKPLIATNPPKSVKSESKWVSHYYEFPWKELDNAQRSPLFSRCILEVCTRRQPAGNGKKAIRSLND